MPLPARDADHYTKGPLSFFDRAIVIRWQGSLVTRLIFVEDRTRLQMTSSGREPSNIGIKFLVGDAGHSQEVTRSKAAMGHIAYRKTNEMPTMAKERRCDMLWHKIFMVCSWAQIIARDMSR